MDLPIYTSEGTKLLNGLTGRYKYKGFQVYIYLYIKVQVINV